MYFAFLFCVDTHFLLKQCENYDERFKKQNKQT